MQAIQIEKPQVVILMIIYEFIPDPLLFDARKYGEAHRLDHETKLRKKRVFF